MFMGTLEEWYDHWWNTVLWRSLQGIYVQDKILIEKIERCFTEMIPVLKDTDYDSRLWKLRLWTFEERRNRGYRADLIRV